MRSTDPATTRAEHSRSAKWLILALATITVLVAAAVILSGLPGVQRWLYAGQETGVSCTDLPTRTEVESAMSDNGELIDQLEGLGPNVKVTVQTPCDDANKAHIEVSYPTRADMERISEILDAEDFGVPTSLRNI